MPLSVNGNFLPETDSRLESLELGHSVHFKPKGLTRKIASHVQVASLTGFTHAAGLHLKNDKGTDDAVRQYVFF